MELFNLSASGYLKFDLPRVALRFVTWIGSQPTEHRASLHTVLLEPDVPRVILVWQTAVPCQGKKLKIRSTEIRKKEYVEL